jgi:hypothetical protein
MQRVWIERDADLSAPGRPERRERQGETAVRR